ncbi:MAG: anthranilate synthase component I family protein [Gammaproteobacteria bacterium]
MLKNDVKDQAPQKRYMPIYKVLLADTFTPIAALECLRKKYSEVILLESGVKFRDVGTCSFLGVDPYARFCTKNGKTTITVEHQEIQHETDPLALLRKFHQDHQCILEENPEHEDLTNIGQMMGFFAHDAVHYFEELPKTQVETQDYPDMLFNFYRINVIFNHEKNQLILALIVEVGDDLAQVCEDAYQELDALIKFLQTVKTVFRAVPTEKTSPFSFDIDCSDEVFAQKVKQAQAYIQAGDAFQIVLSRTFSKPFAADPLSVYRTLRYSNPTPYMFYLATPAFVAFGASPERLVSLTDREVVITPIAGTVPIGQDDPQVLLEKLKNDPKERAEHMMLVDLARNDIGAVCEIGSVQVAACMQPQRLTHVMHMVSDVKGRLAEAYDAFDLLRHTFPAGTLSGAPKIRALEIIAELESSKRYLYGGAICKIDVRGNLDSCIIIRTAVVKDGTIAIRTGAGIVFDSNPLNEVNETQHKAKGMLTAINSVECA